MQDKYRMIRKDLSFVFGETGTTSSQVIAAEGQIKHIHVRTPNFNSNATSTLTIEDEDSYEIYSSGAKNESTNANITDMVVCLTGKNTVKITLSVAAGTGGGTVIVVLYYFGWEPGF